MTMTRVERTSNKDDGMAGKAAGKKKTGNCSGEYGGCKGNAPKETVTGEGESMVGATGAGRLQHVSLTFLLFDFESTSINVRDSNDNKASVNGSSFA